MPKHTKKPISIPPPLKPLPRCSDSASITRTSSLPYNCNFASLCTPCSGKYLSISGTRGFNNHYMNGIFLRRGARVSHNVVTFSTCCRENRCSSLKWTLCFSPWGPGLHAGGETTSEISSYRGLLRLPFSSMHEFGVHSQ